MTQSGNAVEVLTAPAGAGKTFAFAAAGDAWERAGYHVIGAAHTGVAADELAIAAGIPSTTIARLRIAIDRNEPGALDGRSVLILDEAGTAGTRDLARLLAETERVGAKLVISGDPRQLPEIAAGGLFGALCEQQPTIELRDNRRQQHEWEIEALRQLRDGNTTRAFHAYLNHGRITVGHDAHHTKTLLVADWWAACVAGQDTLMLAGRRADVAELNLSGHLRAEAAGHLRGPVLDVAGAPIRAGDKVMTLRNDRAIGVRNGNRGVVLDVLAAALQRRHAKQLALDHITPVPIEAWSTPDLLAERGRIGSILSHAPPDRSADLEALRAAHRQAEAEVAERRQAVSELERRRRPLRERRQPDYQLTTASNRLSVSERRAERLQHEIGAVEASQHRHASHLTTHRADRLELDLIDRQLDDRLRRQINRVVKELPSYITKALGPRPHDTAMDRVWVKAVIEIEKHRLENGITDQRTAIGPEPTDPAMLNTWRRRRWTIDETHQTLTPSVLGSDRTPTPSHRPELGISL